MKISFVIAALLLALAGCSEQNNVPGNETQPAVPTAAGACVDLDADNYSAQQLIDLKVLPYGEDWRGIADPILSKVPAGGYAKVVKAICPKIPESNQELKQWAGMRGKFAYQAFELCLQASGSGGKPVDEIIQKFTAALPSANDNDAKQLEYLQTLWRASAEFYCPQYFGK